VSESLALLTEAEKLAKVADEVSAAYATELARVLRDLERELRALALDAVQRNSKTALSRAVRAARLRKQIQVALKAAGYERFAHQVTSINLDRLLAQVERLRGAARLAAFTTSDLTRILALKELAKLDVLGQGEAIAHAVWRTFAAGLFSQRPLRDLLDDLSTAIDVELYEARTLYDTTVNVFARQVEALKSKGDPDEVYAYLGPADRKLRPFCHARVGKVFTRREIDAMDNEQLPNVFLTGGGYNCRHSWIALSKLSDLRELVGTDQRMPDVEQQLAEVGGRKAA
jgi:hypothetical protein